MTREQWPWAIGQLRHLYAQMVNGHVRDVKSAATGLLGPAIEALESASPAQGEAGRDRCIKCHAKIMPQDFAPGEPIICLECSSPAPEPRPARCETPPEVCVPHVGTGPCSACAPAPEPRPEDVEEAARFTTSLPCERCGGVGCFACAPAAPPSEKERTCEKCGGSGYVAAGFMNEEPCPSCWRPRTPGGGEGAK